MNYRSLFITILTTIGIASCASMETPTGEPGISMGDSYAKVLSKLEKKEKITFAKEGEEIQTFGYSELFKSCREKTFKFQGDGGLASVAYPSVQNPQNQPACR
jgi:hypothetical protein